MIKRKYAKSIPYKGGELCFISECTVEDDCLTFVESQSFWFEKEPSVEVAYEQIQKDIISYVSDNEDEVLNYTHVVSKRGMNV